MYNGIGLSTARGSGTNGYVQRNLSAVRKFKDRVDYKNEEELKKFEAQFNKKPNQEILEHDRKRKVEVKCLEMQELMEEQGFNAEEIETKVSQFRKLLMEKETAAENVVVKDDFGRPIATETHQIALATAEKNARWREAFGIAERDDEKKDKEKSEPEEPREKKKKHKRDHDDEKRKHKKRRSQSPKRDKHRRDASPTRKHKHSRRQPDSGDSDSGHKSKRH